MSGTSCDISSASSNIPVPSQPVLLFMLIAYPILTIVGSIGNLLSAFILHPFRTHVSGHVYLACLAIFDTLSLIFNLISFWNMLILKRYLIEKNDIQAVHTIDRLFGSKGVCEIRVYLSFTVRMWSVWTVVILTTERFLLILFPLRFQKFLSPKVAWITIGCSTLLIGLISLPWLFSFSYVVQKDCSTNAQPPSVYELCIPNNVYRVLRLMQIPLIVVLPGIILTFENSKIAFTLAKRRSQWMGSTFSDEGCSNWDKNRNRQSGNEKRSNSAHVNNPMAECHRQAKDQEDRLTLQLLIVSCAFWILSMPSLIFVGLRALAENANTAHHVSETFANGYYVSWFLYQLNMCIDFFIYCVVGSTFRETLWALLERDWSRFHRLRNALCKGRLIDSSDGVTTSDSRRLN